MEYACLAHAYNISNRSPSETTVPLLSLGWIFRLSACLSRSSTMLRVFALSSAACLDEWDLCPWASAQRSKTWWLFCSVPVRGSFLWWLPWQNQLSAAGRGLLKCMSHLYLLVSVVELNSLYSRLPLFFPTLGFTDHQGQKRSFDQTRGQQEVLQYCTETTGWKNSPFSDWFCLLSHGSPQTFKLSDWWKWLLFLTNGICMASQYGCSHEYYSGKLCICGTHSDPPERFGTISIQMLMRFLGSRCRILKVSPCTETISHQAAAAGAAGSLAEESDIYRKPSWNRITNR